MFSGMSHLVELMDGFWCTKCGHRLLMCQCGYKPLKGITCCPKGCLLVRDERDIVVEAIAPVLDRF